MRCHWSWLARPLAATCVLGALGLVLSALANGNDSAPSAIAAASEPHERESISTLARQLDSIFQSAWRDGGIEPAPPSDDAMFLRRITLDLTGSIPTGTEVRTFLADKRPDKRARVVDELLKNPRHSRHMAALWRDVLLPRDTAERTAETFEAWLQSKFHEQVAYDEIVRDILTARVTAGQSEASLFIAAHQTKPEELAASASRAFLGVEVRCAQCHDHPMARWKQDDFWGLAAFFARVQGPTATAPGVRVDDRPDGDVQHPKTRAVVLPRFFDGTEFREATAEPRRAVLARWVTATDNPYFARAAVNRIWWILFGRGMAHPVDDLGPHNRGTYPEVLDVLAADFTSHGADLSRTLRIVAATRAYQLSSAVPAGTDGLEAAYAAMPVRSLSARQVYDSLLQAAGNRETLEAASPMVKAERQAFLRKFDVPFRQATEFQGGIPQTLTLLNGPFVARMVDPSTGDLLAALDASPFLNDDQRVETLFLATLSRYPDEAERTRIRKLLADRGPTGRPHALGDILWALLNSSEFVMNR